MYQLLKELECRYYFYISNYQLTFIIKSFFQLIFTTLHIRVLLNFGSKYFFFNLGIFNNIGHKAMLYWLKGGTG